MNVADIYKIYSGREDGAEIFIGGLDATMYATVNDFVTYFRERFDPSYPAVFTLADILEYETEPAGTGLINVRLRVRAPFNVPSNVFSRYATPNNPSRFTYYIDPEGYSKNIGFRAFANQSTLKNFLIRGVNSLGSQWSWGTSIDYLDFEQLLQLDEFLIHNARNGMQRLNIRNASTMGEDPADDTVLTNFNLNLAGKRNILYLHENMATINNGAPFRTLQQAINRGVEARFISPTNRAIPDVVTDLGIASLGRGFVEFSFTNIPTADFYEVWLTDHSDPNNLINRYFMFAEISNLDKLITGLNPATTYTVRLKTADWALNKSDFADALNFTTALYDFSIQATGIGGTYAKIKINSYATLASIYTITSIEVYVDGVLNNTIFPTDTAYAINLPSETEYDIQVKVITTVNTLISDVITVETLAHPDTEEIFENSVAYWKFNETTGNALDSVNSHDGTLKSGAISRDGTWYDYGSNAGYVEIPDHDDFSFVDAQGNNTDFVIRTVFELSGWNSQNRFLAVAKNESGSSGVREWRIQHLDGKIGFTFWDENNTQYTFETSYALNLNQIYRVGVSCISNEFSLFVDGVIVATEIFNIQFFNGTSAVMIGNSTNSTNLNLVGKQRETVIIKGKGWSAGEISDDYNNGNGITI